MNFVEKGEKKNEREKKWCFERKREELQTSD